MKLINFGVRQHSSFSSRARFCGGPSGQPRQGGCVHGFIAPRLVLKRKERLVGLNANALESHHRARVKTVLWVHCVPMFLSSFSPSGDFG